MKGISSPFCICVWANSGRMVLDRLHNTWQCSTCNITELGQSSWDCTWANRIKALDITIVQIPWLICEEMRAERASQALVVRSPPANAGDVKDASSITESGRSFGVGHGNLLHYSCLERTEEPGGLWSIRSHRVGHNFSDSMYTREQRGSGVYSDTVCSKVRTRTRFLGYLLILDSFHCRYWC